MGFTWAFSETQPYACLLLFTLKTFFIWEVSPFKLIFFAISPFSAGEINVFFEKPQKGSLKFSGSHLL